MFMHEKLNRLIPIFVFSTSNLFDHCKSRPGSSPSSRIASSSEAEEEDVSLFVCDGRLYKRSPSSPCLCPATCQEILKILHIYECLPKAHCTLTG